MSGNFVSSGVWQPCITAKLISTFVFATQIVQSLYFLNPKFQASSHLLRLYSPVCVRPGRKPRRLFFSQRGSYCIFLQVKNCTVGIVDDNIYEDDEMFMLKLARPLGTDQCEARIGTLNSTNITITNSEDGQY